MKKKFFMFLLVLLVLQNCITFVGYAANFIHSFTDEEWSEIEKNENLYEIGFSDEFDDGPGYDILKEKYGTDDFKVILDGEDKTYGFENNNASEIVAPKDAKKGISSDTDFKLTKRDKKIEMKVLSEEKKEDKKNEKLDKEEEKGSKRVRISLVIEKNHPNNPTPGNMYVNTHIIYTDCDTLGDAMREAGLTDDSGVINVIDGINGYVTVENGITGWKGYSWMLYQNGRQTNVGADQLPIEDGTIVRWRAEFVDMSW